MAQRVLLATDGSDQSKKAEEYVAKHFDPADTQVAVMAVAERVRLPRSTTVGGYSPQVDVEELQEDILNRATQIGEETVERLAEKGFNATREVPRGHPGEEIVAWADENDVQAIVMGRRGRGSLRELLMGSVSQYVVHHASRPVIVVSDEL